MAWRPRVRRRKNRGQVCNPRDEKGNNATPNRHEVKNCTKFLKRTIALVNPKIVVTLGATALNAVRLIELHDIDLASGVRRSWDWFGRILIPAYHPGQRAMIHRSFLNQLSDYNFIAETHRRLTKPRRQINTNKKLDSLTAHIAEALIRYSGSLTYFRLHKLFYLVEYEHARARGERATNAYIIRQKDGPYVTDLHIRLLKKNLSGLRIQSIDGEIRLSKSGQDEMFRAEPTLEPELADLVERVVEKHRERSEGELKKAVYLTSPMRSLLRMEKRQGCNFLNAPVDFSKLKAA